MWNQPSSITIIPWWLIPGSASQRGQRCLRQLSDQQTKEGLGVQGTNVPKFEGKKTSKISKISKNPKLKMLQQSIWYVLMHFFREHNFLKTHLSTMTGGGRKNMDLDLDKGNRMKLSWAPLIRHCSQRKRRPAVFLFHVTLYKLAYFESPNSAPFPHRLC